MDIGLGLYGAAREVEADFWGTMAQLKLAGITSIEPLFALSTDTMKNDPLVPSWFKAVLWDKEKVLEVLPKLREMGIDISSMHPGVIPGSGFEQNIREIIEISELTGIKYFITSLKIDSAAKCEEGAAMMMKANEMLDSHGIVLGYHNHDMESAKVLVNNQEIMLLDYFMDLTDDSVRVQIDTGWMMYGGGDILEFLEKYKNRILSVHLKDFIQDYKNTVTEAAFCAIGSGVLPAHQILKMLSEFNLMPQGLIIDQDRAAVGEDIFDNLRQGVEFIKDTL